MYPTMGYLWLMAPGYHVIGVCVMSSLEAMLAFSYKYAKLSYVIELGWNAQFFRICSFTSKFSREPTLYTGMI